jgi:hypothetical protein
MNIPKSICHHNLKICPESKEKKKKKLGLHVNKRWFLLLTKAPSRDVLFKYKEKYLELLLHIRCHLGVNK